jgi:hypothetical protein
MPADDEGRERHASWWLVAVGALVVAVAAVAAAAGVHHACFDPPPPVIRPDPGTPRGEYCSAVLSAKPWITLTVGPTLLVLVASMAVRRRPWAIVAVATILATVLIADAIVANQLAAAQTI